MPSFGTKSRANRDECHPLLRELLDAIIVRFDISVIEGIRSKEKQNEYFDNGWSKLQWPNGKHNVTEPGQLSLAFDVTPWPCVWPNLQKQSPEEYGKVLATWYYMGGLFMKEAELRGIQLRWGGDWDGDQTFEDQSFDDLGHFELLSTERLATSFDPEAVSKLNAQNLALSAANAQLKRDIEQSVHAFQTIKDESSRMLEKIHGDTSNS